MKKQGEELEGFQVFLDYTDERTSFVRPERGSRAKRKSALQKRRGGGDSFRENFQILP